MNGTLSRVTLQTVIPALRTHFFRATVAKDYAFLEEDEKLQKQHYEQPHTIDRAKPTKSFVFTEVIPSETSQTSDKPLSNVFDSYL